MITGTIKCPKMSWGLLDPLLQTLSGASLSYLAETLSLLRCNDFLLTVSWGLTTHPSSSSCLLVDFDSQIRLWGRMQIIFSGYWPRGCFWMAYSIDSIIIATVNWYIHFGCCWYLVLSFPLLFSVVVPVSFVKPRLIRSSMIEFIPWGITER